MHDAAPGALPESLLRRIRDARKVVLVSVTDGQTIYQHEQAPARISGGFFGRFLVQIENAFLVAGVLFFLGRQEQHPKEPSLLQRTQFLFERGLFVIGDGKANVEPRPVFRDCVQPLRHGPGSVPRHFFAAHRRDRAADACKKEPEMIVDFRLRSDRRAGVFRRRFLLDGDSRRQSGDQIDIRLVHAFEKLPRIGAQAFDIAPLALGIDRVKGQGRFTRAGRPGEDNDFVARQLQVNPFQIVLPGAANDDGSPGRARRAGYGVAERAGLRLRRDRFPGSRHACRCRPRACTRRQASRCTHRRELRSGKEEKGQTLSNAYGADRMQAERKTNT